MSFDHADGYVVACTALAAGWQRPPRMTVTEWADHNRILTSSESSQPGQWRTELVPFLREIMDCLSPFSPVQRVAFMKSTQVAGTESLLNWVGAVIDLYPGPMLVVEPTIEIAELWSKQRLANMVVASPTLSKKIRPARSRDSGNTTLLKEFPGGLLRIAGGNSATSLRSMPVRFLGLDEVDAYPDDVDGEGDPVRLAEERTNNFPRRKVFLISTPTVHGASRIEREWELSDQRRYHVPCPHCGHKQPLRWSHLIWNEDLSAAWYRCEECSSTIDEHNKTWMLANGEWVPTYPERLVRGYHINSLYSPIGLGRTWLERARQWVEAQGKPLLLKSFINTALGEPWEDRSNQLKHNDVQARAEPYKLRTIPRGCLLLTCGVDVQDNRLAICLLGWGRNETAWVLDWFELPGSPADDTLWAKLDQYLATPVLNQFDIPMRIEAVAVDTGGHYTHAVYNFCRVRAHRRILAIKGETQPNRPILGKPTAQDVNWQGKLVANGVQLWKVGTDTAKTAILNRLQLDSEAPVHERRIHFSQDLDEEYYLQLTAEVFDPEKNRWRKRRERNEALDCFVYGYAAALHPDLRIHTAREADWRRLEEVLEPAVGDLFTQAVSDAGPPAQPTETPTQPADSGGLVVSGAREEWLAQADDEWLT